MDNLTHSLVGALLGQMGLKRKTGLAMPTLIIAANIPDIDAVTVLFGGHQHLALRRGLTHGPIAMVILPLLLWGAILWFDAWQTRRPKRSEKRLPVHKGWLLGLAYIGCLSHPLFDWFNSYGVRLLEPFSSRWFYGDTLFIVDVWIWTALITGVCLSFRLERSGQDDWRRPAWIALTAICAYIFANGAITGAAEAQAMQELRSRQDPAARRPDPLVVANPVPIEFWRRDILWRTEAVYGDGQFNAFKPSKASLSVKNWNCEFRPCFPPTEMAGYLNFFANPQTKSIIDSAAVQDIDVRAYLFWSRMPVVKESSADKYSQIFISDQRFLNPLVADRFRVKIKMDK